MKRIHIMSAALALMLGQSEALVDGKAPLIYVGGANRAQEMLDKPQQWEFVRKNADGFYVNFVQMQKITYDNQSNLDRIASHFRKKYAFYETNGNYNTDAFEKNAIDRLQRAGFTIKHNCNDSDIFSDSRLNILRNHALRPGQKPRKCLALGAPWAVDGNINNDTTPWPPEALQPREWRDHFHTGDGFSTDGPMGYWTIDAGKMKAGLISVVKYANARNKHCMVMTSPFHGNVGEDRYSFADYLKRCKEQVVNLEDNDADPSLWGVYEYATDFPTVPEKNSNGSPANTITGFAYYLINHIKGIPNTLDLYVTDQNGGKTTGSGSYSPSSQLAVMNSSVSSGTVRHYKINIKNRSSWCDYVPVLKAATAGASMAGWKAQYKFNGADITSQVQGSGYLFYKGNRLNPNTTRTVDLYLTRTSAAANKFVLDLTLRPHRGSPVVDVVKIADHSGINKPAITVSTWTNDASTGIDTKKYTYTHAYNFGNIAENATINGVKFTGIAGGNPNVRGRFSFDMPSTAVDHTRNVGGTLAVRLIYGNSDATLSLQGLTVGKAYRTTIYTVGWDASGARASKVRIVGTGISKAVDVNSYGENNGAKVEIDFVASGTTQDITFDALGTGTFHTYAFVNAELLGGSDNNDNDNNGGSPVAPTVSVASTTTSSIALKWNKTAANYYYIYARIKGGSWFLAGNNITGTSFTINSLKADTSYEIDVYAAYTSAGKYPSSRTTAKTANNSNNNDNNDDNDNSNSLTNIAKGKTVKASSTWSGSYDSKYVNDGKGNTRWASAQTGGNRWCYVDLGKSYNIQAVTLKWESAYGKNYTIKVWNGSSWKLIKTVNNNSSLTNKITGLNSNSRYVLMECNAAPYSHISLWEFEVYGK